MTNDSEAVKLGEKGNSNRTLEEEEEEFVERVGLLGWLKTRLNRNYTFCYNAKAP